MSKADRAWADYSERFRTEAFPKIVSSGAAVSIISGDGSDFDVKQATELGAILLLDKPLVLVCVPGAQVPSRLRRAADIVIEDWHPDNVDAQDRLAAALREIAGQDRPWLDDDR